MVAESCVVIANYGYLTCAGLGAHVDLMLEVSHVVAMEENRAI
jgi:hypothetical protein